MFEKFADYMYYLLTAPLKKIRKSKNQWYILMKVLGRRFDQILNDIDRARDQTAVATCEPELLPEYAADRGITRYTGETDENFRVRIANYTEILRLGGTDEGVLLIPAKEYTGDAGRWAEFYIVLKFGVDDMPVISLEALRNQVRRVKEVGAKDNYSYQYEVDVPERERVSLFAVQYLMLLVYYPYLALDGEWKLDGSKKLNSRRKQYPVRSTYKPKITTQEQISRVICHEEHNLFFLDGSWKLDGSKKLSAWQRTEEL